MKLNKNIIIAAVAGITTISPIVSQASVALADTISASTEPAANGTNTSNSSAATTPEATQDTPKVEPISLPIQDKDSEPQAKLLKTNKHWSKRHKRANKYYNKNVKKAKNLDSNTAKVKVLKKTLKHFKSYKTNYAKRFKKYLNAEIAWLNRQIDKENTDVPTTKPSGELEPTPVNPKPVTPDKPKKPKDPSTEDHGGWKDTVVFDSYLNNYKYYSQYKSAANRALVERDIKALKKRGYKFNSNLSDTGYREHNNKLAERDNKLLDEGKLN